MLEEPYDMDKYPNPSFKDFFDITLKLGDKIDFQWNVYYTVNLGVIAASSSITDSLETLNILLLIVGLLIFLYFSCLNLLRLYSILDVSIVELSEIASQTSFLSDKVNDYKDRATGVFSFKRRSILVVVAHFLAGLLSVGLILKKPILFLFKYLFDITH
jgi:hypothetical protein